MAKFVVCLTTVAKSADAEKIARHLVKERLAACVNVIPGVMSHYVWKGKQCRDREFILLMKTGRRNVGPLEKEIGEIHPYELPEFIVLPIQSGSKKYLAWLEG